ncbi:MAG: hypothetical protein ACKVQQ_00430 [Burkholderiales bacterium]
MSGRAPGAAFLALWNGVSESARHEYETWHAIEHVPERTAFPGFIETWRYRAAARGAGYFSCYWLAHTDTLGTPQYRDVLSNPSAWSARMRSLLTDMVRMPCSGVGAAGESLGAHTLVLRLRRSNSAQDTLDRILSLCLERDGIVAAHWGTAALAEDHPLASAVADSNAVAMLHGTDPAGLARVQELLSATFLTQDIAVNDAGRFDLIQVVRHADVATPDGARRRPRDDLMRRYSSKDE